MSRCFPFPPPGYVNKATNDHADLLAKEKHKEKKHKKEKRDKEKREGKEKRDKEKNNDKHKDKKERKEKHKDKKKDKDKRAEGRTQGSNENKLGDSFQKVEGVQDSKFTEELDRRIRNEGKGAAHTMFEAISGSTQRKAEGFDTRIAIGKERINGLQMVGVLISREQKSNNGMGQATEKEANKELESKEKAKHKEADGRKGDRNTNKELESEEKAAIHMEADGRKGDRNTEVKDSKFTNEYEGAAAHKLSETFGTAIQRKANVFVTATTIKKEQSSGNKFLGSGGEQRRNDGMDQSVEKDLGKNLERKEKGKQKNSDEKKSNVYREVKDPKVTNGLDKREAQSVEKDLGKTMEKKEKGKQKNSDEKKSSVYREVKDPKITNGLDKSEAHTMVDNFIGSIQRRALGLDTANAFEKGQSNANELVRGNHVVGGALEKSADKTTEGKEKAKEKGNGDGKGGGKHKEKRKKGEDIAGHREKEKEKEKEKVKARKMHKENDTPKEIEKKDQIVGLNLNPFAPHDDNEKHAGADGSVNKRKGAESNGFVHDDARPNKIPRLAPSSNPNVENGRKMVVSCNPSNGNNKEQMINGTTGAQPSLVRSRPSVAAAPVKPPHPDSKYLAVICRVPEMEEWPVTDELEWLFSSSNHPRHKHSTVTEGDEAPQVWAEALQIGSEDFSALPYVIPY